MEAVLAGEAGAQQCRYVATFGAVALGAAVVASLLLTLARRGNAPTS
jgi:hypothetical protein